MKKVFLLLLSACAVFLIAGAVLSTLVSLANAQSSFLYRVYFPAIGKQTFPGSPRAIAQPRIDVQPQKVDFGSIDLGRVATATATISNTGDAPLVVFALSFGEFSDPDFQVQPNFTLPLTLTTDMRATLDVTFSPKTEGGHRAVLAIFSNDPQRPKVTITLSGIGQAVRNPALFKDDPLGREKFIYDQRAYPEATTPPGARLRAWEHIQRMKSIPGPRLEAVPGSQWNSIGPSNIGGRVNSIAIDRNNPNIVYVGAAQGGVWKTTDDGTTWTPTTDKQPTTAMGSIAIDPNNSNILYAGTGEANGNFDAYFGVGVLKSTNAGASWFRPGNHPDQWIDTVLVDPANSNIIWTAGASGIYSSTNAGLNWNLARSGNAKDLVIDPTNSLRLFATFNGDGIYRTTNAATFQRLTNGLPLASGGGTVSATDKRLTAVGTFPAGSLVATGDSDIGAALIGFQGNEYHVDPDGSSAYSPGEGIYRDNAGHCANSNICKVQAGDTRLIAVGAYAAGSVVAAGDTDVNTNWMGWHPRELHVDPDGDTLFQPGEGIYRDSAFGRVALAMAPSAPNTLYAGFEPPPYAVYKSTDGGNTWSEMPNAPQRCDGQCWYNNVLAVKPNDPNTVYLGQVPLYRSTDGGATWSDISAGPVAIHADQHRIAFKPGDPNTLYIGNDGGVFKSTDGGNTWTKKDVGMTITQFMGIGLHPTAATPGYGGTQDNGEIKYTGTTSWTPLPCCGDAGPTFVDPANPNTVYGEYVNFFPLKSTNAGASWSGITSGLAGFGGVPDESSGFYTPQTIDPINTSNLVAGATNVWRTTNGGGSWASIGGALAGGSISALAIDQATPTAGIWAGTSNGRVEFTLNNGGLWTEVTNYDDGTCPGGTACRRLPNRFVTDIAVLPSNPQVVYVTFSGFNANTPARPGHVFKTTNRGTTWTDISSNLPDLPQNAIVIDPRSTPPTLWLGSDIGIFRSVNDGLSWEVVDIGLPDTAVFDLAMNQVGILRAGTHGRGAFDLFIAGPELSVAKTLRALPSGAARLGDSVTFDISIANTGDTPITRLPLDDLFDSRYLQFASASVAPDAVVGGLAEWKDLARSAPLAAHTTMTLTVSFKIVGCPPDLGTVNKARVNSAFNDAGNIVPAAEATARVPILCTSATLTKTRIGPQRVAQGETVRFDVTIQNTGNVTITTLPLTDTYDPTALTFVSAMPAPNSTVPAGTLTWTDLTGLAPNGFGMPLAPGGSFTVRLTFTADGCPAGQTTTDTARVTGAVATGPAGPISLPTMTASATVDIACPDIRVQKTLVPPPAGAITLGDVATFNIRITNQGNKIIRRLPLRDLFDPAHLAFDSATPAPNATVSGVVQWTDLTAAGPNGFGSDLPPGASVTVVLRLKAVGCPPDQVTTDKAEVTGAIDEENNPVPASEATATVKIACPAVAVTKQVVEPPCGIFGIGQPVPFVITVTNTGNSVLDVVPLVDTYDANILAFASANPTPDAIVPGTLTWNDLTGPAPPGFGVNLPPGGHFTVNVTFTALASTSFQYPPYTVDRATVAGATDEYGFVAATMTGTANATVKDADLFVQKTGPATAVAGSIITWTVAYGNLGPDDATHVRIRDIIPPGTTYLGDTLCGAVNTTGCFIPLLGAGVNGSFQVWVSVPMPTPPGTTLTNEAQIASGFVPDGPICGIPDRNPANNTSRSTVTIIADFGDAPDPPYPTRLASNGAFHRDYTQEWLGATADGEVDARFPDPDDDGVVFTTLGDPPTYHFPGRMKFFVTINTSGLKAARYSAAPGRKLYLRVWLDWNNNGTWEPGEQLVEWSGGPGLPGTDGSLWPIDQTSRTIRFEPSVQSAPGLTWLRFRLSYGAPPPEAGPVDYGEVEDYPVRITSP